MAKSFFLFLCFATALQAAPVRVVVWDERNAAQKEVYTNFIGGQLSSYLETLPDVSVKSAGLTDADKGLSDGTLTNCDVLVWWSHVKNKEVPRAKAREIARLVKEGRLSLIVLHSGLTSRLFIAAMNERTREDAEKAVPPGIKKVFILPKSYKDPKPGDPITPRIEVVTNWPAHRPLALIYLPICGITGWHEDGKPSVITTALPDHPIAQGVPRKFEIPHTELYEEPFHAPKPDAVIFTERHQGGGVFRSGMLWSVGKGKVFYFRPGHETFPVYFNTNVLKIIGNAVEWMGSGAGR
ncbi:MAG: ThuA domain-containing protein [Verrucomicrobia bacterium]|nr:ThuA domain-containing protein [Verrucomicrobiota bacterium]MDE3100037.1 ThuA domain-containing protein [Verrucomicrobiota bacterium]